VDNAHGAECFLHMALVGTHRSVSAYFNASFVLAQGGAASDGDVLAEDRSINLKPACWLLCLVCCLRRRCEFLSMSYPGVSF
jgi:hypothetical protein